MGGNGPDNERSWRPRKGLGLPYVHTGEPGEGCEQGRGADVQFNRTLLAALCGRCGWGVWRRLTAGDWEGSWRSGRSWAGEWLVPSGGSVNIWAKIPKHMKAPYWERARTQAAGITGKNSHGYNPQGGQLGNIHQIILTINSTSRSYVSDTNEGNSR